MGLAGRRAVPMLVAAALGLPMAAASERPRQAEPPRIVFTSPEDGGYASGPMSVSFRLEPPIAPIKSVKLYADGSLLCTLERVPFTCPWNAGIRIVAHQLRAVVVLADGRKFGRSIFTKGEPFTETAYVDRVHVTVSVTDRGGRFVRDLPREGFRLSDRGVRQPISHFEFGNVPLEITVAVDVSGSMTDAMPQVKSAVKKFVSALRPNDALTIIGFNSDVWTLAKPTASLALRLRAIDLLAPWGGTALYNVIVQAIDQLGGGDSRRVLVVFTDGEDRDSTILLDAAERRLETSDAVLYAIGLGRAPKVKTFKTVLERLSQKSGGRAFFEELDGLDRVFASIIEELSNQYLLGFEPADSTHDGAWRPLAIDVPGKDYRIRAKQGYVLKPH